MGGSYPVSVAKQVENHAEYANSIHLVKDKLSLRIKDVEDLEVKIEKIKEIFHMKNRQPHYSPIKTEVEEPLPLDIVYPRSHVALSVMGTNRTGKAHYGLRSLGPLKEEMVHVKKPYNMVKIANAVLGLKASNSGFGCSGNVSSKISNSMHFHLKYEFPADDEMFLEIDKVVFQIYTKGYFEYDPLRVKTKISKRKKTSVIYDEGDDRKKSLVIDSRKGKEKVIKDEGICNKGNKADATIYKRAMVNEKAKMVEDVGAVKRGKDKGVVIEDDGFINDGGKETVVTIRAIGSKKWKEKV
nr:hypothetical protein [Tanacetum cinerariifolium]